MAKAPVYDYLFNDSNYMGFLKKYNELEKKIKRSREQRIDSRVARHFVNREVQKLESEYMEHLHSKLETIQEKKREVRLKHERPVYDDPQQEMLRRQDLDAKLNTMSQDDLKDYVRDIRAADITLYDYNLLSGKIEDTRGMEQQLAQLRHDLSVDNDKDYQDLDEQELFFYNLHGGFNGQNFSKKLFVPDGGDDVTIKTIQDSLTKLFEQYRVPGNEASIGETGRFMKHHEITDEQVNQGAQ